MSFSHLQAETGLQLLFFFFYDAMMLLFAHNNDCLRHITSQVKAN